MSTCGLDHLHNMAGTDFDSTYTSIGYSKFFDNEFRRAVQDDIQRLVPSMVDGLKVCQRKALHYMLSMRDDAVSISSLSGSIADKTFYPHRLSCME